MLTCTQSILLLYEILKVCGLEQIAARLIGAADRSQYREAAEAIIYFRWADYSERDPPAL
jgi:hypothetical protein